jgi:hypothetical protein
MGSNLDLNTAILTGLLCGFHHPFHKKPGIVPLLVNTVTQHAHDQEAAHPNCAQSSLSTQKIGRGTP